MTADAPPPDALRPILARNLGRVLASLEAAARRAGRDPAGVAVVAVTKTVAPAAIRVLASLGRDREGGPGGPAESRVGTGAPPARGVDALGENRVQEAESKRVLLSDLGLPWHMIGHLQTNKVRRALELFHRVHSVDRPSLIEALAAEGARRGTVVDCLLQVNVSGERSKGGFSVDEVEGALRDARSRPSLRVTGLMTLPAPADDPEEARPAFRTLRGLRDRLRRRPGDLPDLSMGMSGDYPVAVEEGATLVRLGSALFEGLPAGLFGRRAAAPASPGTGA